MKGSVIMTDFFVTIEVPFAASRSNSLNNTLLLLEPRVLSWRELDKFIKPAYIDAYIGSTKARERRYSIRSDSFQSAIHTK